MSTIPPERPRAQRTGRRPSNAPSGREALLRAALEVFAQRGFDATSLRDLALQAEVDVALVSRLFGSKQQLWQAVVDSLVAQQQPHLERMQATVELSQSDPREAMRQLISQFAEIAYEIPALVSFLMHEISNPGNRLKTLEARLIKPFRLACEPVLTAAMAAGVVRARQAELLFFMLITAISIALVSAGLLTRSRKPTKRWRNLVTEEACAMVISTH
jgi:AcrR family transcriptional regulator